MGKRTGTAVGGESRWGWRWGEAGLAQDMDLVSAFLFTPDIIIEVSSLDAALEA